MAVHVLNYRRLSDDPSYLLDTMHTYDRGKLQEFATFKVALKAPIEPIKPLSRVKRVTTLGGQGRMNVEK